MVYRDRYKDDEIDRMPTSVQQQEEVVWNRLRGLDFLCHALGSGKEPEAVEALLGPAVSPENPVYDDEDEPESPGEREADLRVRMLRGRVEQEYAALADHIRTKEQVAPARGVG